VQRHQHVDHRHAVVHAKVSNILKIMKGIQMKDIRIYNYKKSKDHYIIRLLREYTKDIGAYYIARSWEHGPHIVVTFSETVPLEEILVLKNNIQQQIDQISIDPEQYEEIKSKYQKSLETIALLEKKEASNVLKEHGTVEIQENKFVYYNQELTNVIHQARIQLQPILEETYLYLYENEIKPEVMYPALFHAVSECYKVDGTNKGYFSFISHVQGFLELSKNQSLKYTESGFEMFFEKNISEVQTFANEHQDFIARWQREWQLIFESYADRIIENIDKQYLKDLETTFSELEGKFKNDFHSKFAMYAKNTNFASNQNATVYRFLINILYLSFPFLKISALKKQLFIYMAYRFTETTYNINWRKEISLEI
ncbi:TPA: hypothetical protein ACQUHI_004316, partial [Bacillus tropicus]